MNFLPPQSGWLRPRVPLMQLQSPGTITGAPDWHFLVNVLTLPHQSVRMGHKAKARYKLVMSQTSVTIEKGRANQ